VAASLLTERQYTDTVLVMGRTMSQRSPGVRRSWSSPYRSSGSSGSSSSWQSSSARA